MSNLISEGSGRDLVPDEAGEIRRGPTPAVVELSAEVLDASTHKQAGRTDAMRERSTIESRAELRIAAVNESTREGDDQALPRLIISPSTATQWADLDASDFGRIRSTQRRESALEAIAANASSSPTYADAIKSRSPNLADAARAYAEERAKVEREAQLRVKEQQRQEELSAAAKSREALLDAAALAAVAAARSRETAKVVEQLASAPDTSTEQLREAQQALKTPALGLPLSTISDPEVAGQISRAIKRPVSEAELSDGLRTRFIVSHEKRGMLDQGAVDFTFRSGDEQGRVAFTDVGKSLSTQRADKATIRAMVEVATAKNWKEVTVSGADDFRRNAWLEANLAGLKVKGYEPRDADLQILSELRDRHKPTNAITSAEPERRAEQVAQPMRSPGGTASKSKHIDGDALTQHERTVLDNSRAILNAKALNEQFTDAALRELEARLRGERVYVGEIVGHGRAPYKFDQANDDSYYVTLKTQAGEQVIWGKGLAEAMQERSVGEQVVLQNIGKRDVTVQERVRDAQGQVVSTRPKESQLNAWKSELLSRFSERARHDFSNRAAARQPTLGVYDSKAQRAPEAKSQQQTESLDPKRDAERNRPSRDR